MDKILILLSTFNGEKYLETQLETILKQDYQNLDILVRDDGSSDSTIKILQTFENNHPNKIHVIYGNNIGYRDSFLALMKTVPAGYSYYAFCDQDDYWLPEKVSQAIKALKALDQTKPLLYCSALTLTDERLQVIGQSQSPQKSSDFRHFFFSSIPTGCTAVFNDKLRLLALPEKNPARNHDSWILIIASFFGEVFIDHRSFILYRQHANNALGLKHSFWGRTSDKLTRILRKDPKFSGISSFARSFLAEYSQLMNTEEQKFVKMVADYQKSFRKTLLLAMSRDVKTNCWHDTVVLRLLIIMRYV